MHNLTESILALEIPNALAICLIRMQRLAVPGRPALEFVHSVAAMARWVGCSPRTMKRYLRELTKLGLLEVVSRPCDEPRTTCVDLPRYDINR